MKNFLRELLPYIIAVVVVLLIKTYLWAPIKVNGASMYPTLHHKDIMILNKINYKLNKIKRFDIVVIKYNDEYIIKRVIGLPGETVSCKDGKIYINKQVIKENFTHEDTPDFPEVKVGKDEYFVLGDNRPNSHDSRFVGPFHVDKILGHATYTLLPFSRWGRKK